MGQRRFRSLVFFALLLFLGGLSNFTPASADSPSQQPDNSKSAIQETPTTVYESATVLRAVTRLVVVDVVATNNDGVPVADLKAEDFSIIEEGKEQKIRAFSFQHPPTAGNTEPRPKPVDLPPNVFSNIPKYKSDTALNILLLDGLNTNLPNQAYARDQMIKYLARIPEGQPVAVYLLDRKLHLLQDFTSDPSLLKDVVKNLKGSASPVQDNPGGGTEMELAPPGAFDSGMIPAEMQEAMQRFENERVAFQTDLRVQYTLDALNSLARALSGYAGRKNLIWVSEAFPLSINPDFTLSTSSFNSMRNYAPLVAEAAENLTDAEVAVYPVDARGLTTSAVFSATNSGRDKFGRSLGRPGRMTQAISNESAALQAAHDSMEELAERTGGKAFYNRNDLDGAIRRSIDDGSTYYTLAYYPENKDWNGKFRKIHVKVARSGVKLRHRLGYFALDPKMAAEADPKRQAIVFGKALNLDFPVSTALRFHAGVVQPSEKTEKKVLVNFGLDPHAVSFEKQDDGLEHAVVDCAVQAYTEKGKLLKTEATTLKLALQPETFRRVMQTIVPCQREIDLPPGNYLLRLGVMDDRTSLIGTTNARVTINAAAVNKTEEKKP
ncbi:MAG TPA: VWA domain-containing protein [Candidatus Angelobacter sp.]|nr:VWA domain-containing protein [Candidatus Angelobacter sp.]